MTLGAYPSPETPGRGGASWRRAGVAARTCTLTMSLPESEDTDDADEPEDRGWGLGRGRARRWL